MTNKKLTDKGNNLWGPCVFFAIGLYCFYTPESLFLDDGWNFVENKTLLGYACGAIFCGGALLFFNQYLKPSGFRKASQCCEFIGFILTIIGWGYTFWTLFGP